jgi:hypothetical protein
LVDYDDDDDDDDEEQEQARTPPVVDEVDQSWRAILTGPVVRLLIAYSMLALHTVVFEELLPVFFLTRAETGKFNNGDGTDRGPSRFPFHLVGGMGMNSEDVGSILSSNGIVGIFVMVIIYPWIDSTFGTLMPFRWMTRLIPIIYFVVPYFILLLNLDDWNLMYGVVTIVVCVRTVLNSIINPSILLIINRSPASPRHLGVINGCAQVSASFARAFGPIVWGYFMAFGQDQECSWLPWWLICAFTLVAVVQSQSIVDKEDEEEEEQEDTIVEA